THRAPSRRYALLPLSARSEAALDATMRRMSAFLADHPDSALRDVAYTLAVGRRAFAHRSALVARTATNAREALESSGAPPAPVKRGVARAASRAVFLFPGQGTQY